MILFVFLEKKGYYDYRDIPAPVSQCFVTFFCVSCKGLPCQLVTVVSVTQHGEFSRTSSMKPCDRIALYNSLDSRDVIPPPNVYLLYFRVLLWPWVCW